jgi:hypothetical protein
VREHGGNPKPALGFEEEEAWKLRRQTMPPNGFPCKITRKLNSRHKYLGFRTNYSHFFANRGKMKRLVHTEQSHFHASTQVIGWQCN